jgi:hypothetical protein
VGFELTTLVVITDHDDITEVLLKVVLNTLNPNPNTANFDMYQYISLVMSTVSVIRRCYKFIFVCRPIVAVVERNKKNYEEFPHDQNPIANIPVKPQSIFP